MPVSLGTTGSSEKRNNRSSYFKEWYQKNRKKKEETISHVKEVGLSTITENGKRILLLYRHCHPDLEGWVESRRFKPLRHDLCEMKNVEGKIFKGWWEGSRWNGLRLKPGTKIICWRRCDSVM